MASSSRGAAHTVVVGSLHRAAYNNNVRHLQGLLQRMPQEQYAQLDLHGNTVRLPAWCLCRCLTSFSPSVLLESVS